MSQRHIPIFFHTHTISPLSLTSYCLLLHSSLFKHTHSIYSWHTLYIKDEFFTYTERKPLIIFHRELSEKDQEKKFFFSLKETKFRFRVSDPGYVCCLRSFSCNCWVFFYILESFCKGSYPLSLFLQPFNLYVFCVFVMFNVMFILFNIIFIV